MTLTSQNPCGKESLPKKNPPELNPSLEDIRENLEPYEKQMLDWIEETLAEPDPNDKTERLLRRYEIDAINRQYNMPRSPGQLQDVRAARSYVPGSILNLAPLTAGTRQQTNEQGQAWKSLLDHTADQARYFAEQDCLFVESEQGKEGIRQANRDFSNAMRDACEAETDSIPKLWPEFEGQRSWSADDAIGNPLQQLPEEKRRAKNEALLHYRAYFDAPATCQNCRTTKARRAVQMRGRSVRAKVFACRDCDACRAQQLANAETRILDSIGNCEGLAYSVILEGADLETMRHESKHGESLPSGVWISLADGRRVAVTVEPLDFGPNPTTGTLKALVRSALERSGRAKKGAKLFALFGLSTKQKRAGRKVKTSSEWITVGYLPRGKSVEWMDATLLKAGWKATAKGVLEAPKWIDDDALEEYLAHALDLRDGKGRRIISEVRGLAA